MSLKDCPLCIDPDMDRMALNTRLPLMVLHHSHTEHFIPATGVILYITLQCELLNGDLCCWLQKQPGGETEDELTLYCLTLAG